MEPTPVLRRTDGASRGSDSAPAGSLPDRIPPSLEQARTAYGGGTAVWAHVAHRVEPTWWLALSGTYGTDYNLSLLHGDDARSVLPEVLGQIDASGKPAVIALAGAGLGGAQLLADAGWVCVGSLPLMYRESRPATKDERVRPLGEQDLSAARALLTATFSVHPDVAEALFRTGLTERQGVRTWGLFDPDLVSCAVTAEVGELYVGWALATAPNRQHHGYGSSLLHTIDHWYRERGAKSSLHLGTPAGAKLYEARGHTTLEHWQLWSKPRWVLGRS